MAKEASRVVPGGGSTAPGSYDQQRADQALASRALRRSRDVLRLAGILTSHGWYETLGMLWEAEGGVGEFRDNSKDAEARRIIIDARRAAKRAREPQLVIRLKGDRNADTDTQHRNQARPALRVRLVAGPRRGQSQGR